MRQRPVPKSGELIPVLGLGTKRTFDSGCLPSPARARLGQVLEAFVAGGGRLVDTSPMYGCAEAALGELAAERALTGALFLATKIWTEGAESGRAQVEASFSRLRTDRIDLVLVHNMVDWRVHIPMLRGLKEAGRVRYIGVSHYNHAAYPALMDVLRSEPLDFIQINYSLMEREAERELLPFAAELGLAVVANRPFAEGAQFRRLRNHPVPGAAAELGLGSWPALALAFVLSHPDVTAAIPATADLHHLAENLAVAGIELTAAQRAQIAEAFELVT